MSERVNCACCGSRDVTENHLAHCKIRHAARTEAESLGAAQAIPSVATADLWAHLGHVASPQEATRIVRQVVDLGWRPVVGRDPKRKDFASCDTEGHAAHVAAVQGPMNEHTAEKLSKAHRDVLVMIADRTDATSPDPGWMTSSATFADAYNVGVHWRTAQTLHRRGLVTYPNIASGWDGDATSIALTEKGWAAIGRNCPIPPTQGGAR